MNQHSILDLGIADNSPQVVGFPPPSATIATALLFPGEDGGQSLAEWARRDLEATLQLLADRAQYITGGSGAAIALRDGENIICRASSGPSAPEIGSYFQASSGLSGESVRTRKILCCNDTSTDPRVNHEGCRALGIISFAVLPLIRQDEVVGIFEIFANKAQAFGERDILALQRMGEMVNTALDQVSYPGPRAAKNTQSPGPLAARSAPTSSMASTNAARHESQSVEESDALFEGNGNGSSDLFEEPEDRLAARAVDGAPNQEPGEPATRPSGSVLSVRRCTACGFPISEGRSLCLDCEAAGNSPAVQRSAPGNATPAFLAELGDPRQPAGIGHWISTHRYLLGMIGVTLSTIIFLLTR